MLALVVLWTVMCCDEKVFSTETLGTVLALEWKKVDEQTRRLGALLSDGQELSVTVSVGVGCHCRDAVKVKRQGL